MLNRRVGSYELWHKEEKANEGLEDRLNWASAIYTILWCEGGKFLFSYFGGLLMFLLFEASLLAIFHFIYTSHHSKADSSSSSSSSSYSYLKFTELCALFLCENNIQHHKIRSFVIFFLSSSYFFILFSYCYVGGFGVQYREQNTQIMEWGWQHSTSIALLNFFFHFFCDMTRWIILFFYAFLSTYAWVVG